MKIRFFDILNLIKVSSEIKEKNRFVFTPGFAC